MKPVKEKVVTETNPTAYFIESSKEFDQVMHIIGRNRKYLINLFGEISRTKNISYEVVKDVLSHILRSTGVNLENDHFPLLIKFAEKDGIVDYKYMLEVYKER